MISPPLIELFKRLEAGGIRIWQADDQLRFEAPQGVMTSEIRAELAARKPEIIDFLKKAQPVLDGRETVIPRLAPGTSRLLSFSQERLWFLNQLEESSPIYNMGEAWRMTGLLDVSAFEMALAAVVKRHELLRATFGGSSPDQPPEIRVGSIPDRLLHVIQLSATPTSEVESATQKIIDEEFRHRFDLGLGPLVRVTLIHLNEHEHVLVVVMHHIISDATSLDIFHREMAVNYADAVAGRPISVTPLPLQFADFAGWQRQQLQGAALARLLDYWKKRLAGIPPELDLPTDFLRPPRPSDRGDFRSRIIAPDLAGQLASLCRQTGATSFMGLLASFQILLHRLSSQDDIVVGFPASSRDRIEVEGIIGFFVNMLAFRSEFSSDLTARELIQQVRRLMLDDLAHHDLPFDRLVEALKPERTLSRTPLFQVVLVYQEATERVGNLPGLQVDPWPTSLVSPKFDLTCVAIETGDGLHLSFEYRTDLFAGPTMDRWLLHFETLLREIVNHPDEPVTRLNLLTPAERNEVLTEWNQTKAGYEDSLCAHQLFERNAKQNPDNLAVILADQELSYRQLDERTTRLARKLRQAGIGPDALVALYTRRSVEQVVGLLAIMKAGGAYVPLDPAYPADRLAFMLADAGASVLLTQREIAAQLPRHDARVILLDEEPGPETKEPGPDPPRPSGPENLAYVIYTSGSTGKPKGTLLQHGGLCNLVSWQRRVFKITAQSRILQFASPGFDASVWETFMALGNGATLVLVPQELIQSSPQDMAAYIRAKGITHATLPPSLLSLLPADDLPALTTLVSAGEPCSVELVNQWSPGRQFVNAYGPTESTVCASAFFCRGEQNVPPPIGRPIQNTRLYVLDRALQPVPVGVPGELHIGGICLARGYLNRPALTAEKFIADPFSIQPSARLYKTGDRARFLPDGNLEFLGRKDYQVKIRGFRIELQEIESALASHPSVRECVVTVREDRPGEKYLVAHVVTHDDQPSEPGQLKAMLQQIFPAHMVPSAFVFLPSLPLTPNGKIDRSQLPGPTEDTSTNREPVRPVTSLDHQLLEIWEELLGKTGLGIRDNFFDLGGHSLLAVRMLGLIQQRLGLKVRLSTLFDTPTVEHLAQNLLAGQLAQDRPYWRPHADAIKPPFFFFHGDFTGGGFYCRLLAAAIGTDWPFYGIHPHGLLGDKPPPTIEEMALDRIQLLRKLAPVGPYFLGGYCNGGLVALEVARLLQEQGERVGTLILHHSDLRRWNRPWVRTLADLAGRFNREPSQDRLQRHIRWQNRVDFSVDVLRNQLSEIRAMKHQPWSESRHQIAAKIQRWKQRLNRNSPESTPSWEDSPSVTVPAVSNSLETIYADAVHGYLPRTYHGAIILCWPDEQTADLDPGGRAGWDKFCTSVRVILIPGDHQTSLTKSTHVAALGQSIRTCLDVALKAVPAK